MARHGENIRKRKDGRWEARFIERHEFGEAKYRYVYGKTYAEAKSKRNELMKMVLPPPTSTKVKTTFSELSNVWLAFVKSRVKESTYTRYARNMTKYIIPRIGKYALAELTVMSLNDFVTELLEHGGVKSNALSPKTVSDILCVLKLCLSYGEENGYPCPNLAKVKHPKAKPPSVKVIPTSDVQRLKSVLITSDDTISLGIMLSLYTGLRIGEICALRWKDIDLAHKRLYVTGTVERIAESDCLAKNKTKVVIAEPKTDSGNRVIPLPRFLADHLKAFSHDPDHYILSGGNKPSEPHTIYVRYKRFLKRNGFGNYTFHALRHTFATVCAESGFETKLLSELLGHSSVTTTLSRYVHPSFEAKQQWMEALFDKELSGQKQGQRKAHI